MTQQSRRTTLALVVLSAGALLSESAAQGQGKKGGDLLPCSAKFRIAAADVFQADPILFDATYNHADNGQISVGKLQGRLRIDTTKFNPTGAKMNVQATVCQARCTGTLPARLVDVVFQTHTEYATNPVSGVLESTGAVLDLRSMNLGDIAYTRLWVDVPGSGGSGKSFKLAFNNQTEGAFCCNCVDGKPAKVTCLEENSSGACRKWSIEGEKACLYEFSKGGGPVVEHGLFSAPFKIESLTLLP